MEYKKKVDPDGTKLSGFVRGNQNQMPRECHNCIFYKHDHCYHPVVMIDEGVLGEDGEPKPVEDHDCCNFFQSPAKVLLFAVRHGSTEANTGRKFRGNIDFPLDKQGEKEAEEAAEFLKDSGAHMVYSSDLARAQDTAKVIAKELGIGKVYTDHRLRPWNIGELAGKDKTKESEAMLDEYIDNPSWIVPGGESLDQFSDRMQEVLDFYMHEARNEGIKILVFHTSNLCQLEGYCAREPLNKKPEGQDSVKTGGIIKVEEKQGKLRATPVFRENGPAEYGQS